MTQKIVDATFPVEDYVRALIAVVSPYKPTYAESMNPPPTTIPINGNNFLVNVFGTIPFFCKELDCTSVFNQIMFQNTNIIQ